MTPRRVADIDYMLERSDSRRTADIVIERNGKVQVRAPRHLPDERVDELIETKRLWIYKALAEWRDLNATRIVRAYRNGEGFLYLGRSYRLILVSDQDEPLALRDGRFRLRRDLVDSGDIPSAQAAFRDFYIVRGQERLTRRVAYFAPKVGVKPGAVTVADLGNRWATNTATGRLRFHWKCLMAPATIIDYIAVHELCHAHHRDHTDAFWNEVDKVLPDWQERKAWLRLHGAAMEI
ncbi:MAG: M48 family metallopeptidase [Chloroflexi bacterium]|nr:M48 family metallopeptidase [Chloroflexota bacterium]